jgi:hypothetical protein
MIASGFWRLTIPQQLRIATSEADRQSRPDRPHFSWPTLLRLIRLLRNQKKKRDPAGVTTVSPGALRKVV